MDRMRAAKRERERVGERGGERIPLRRRDYSVKVLDRKRGTSRLSSTVRANADTSIASLRCAIRVLSTSHRDVPEDA